MSGTPGEGIFCYFIGIIAFAIGGLMLFYGFGAQPSHGGYVGYGFALIFSSAIWFAIGRALKILAQIDRNTKPKQ